MAQATTSLPADNPFASPSTLPYQTPAFDTIREEHYLPAFAVGMAEHLAGVRVIAADAAPPSFVNTLEALERDGALLDRVSAAFFNLTGTDTTRRLQEIQAEIAPKLAAHGDAIWLDAQLFARVQAVHDARDSLTGPEQRRLAERYYTTFVRHGAKLSPDKQQRLREINELSSKLTTQFQERLLADTKDLAVVVDDAAQLAGLDASAVSAAQQAAEARGLTGKFLLTLQLPSSQGILSSLDVRETRRRVFEASVARCDRGNEHDTKDLIVQLAALRAEKAALLGYPTHAHYVLDDETAGTPDAVTEMLASMTPAIVTKARGEAAELQAWLDAQQPGTKLAPWDWSWVAERVRRARYDLDESAVKQFFELERVLQDGLFFMAKQLYGVTMKERHDLPVYHPDVRVFEVFDGDAADRPIGLFYADYYTRDSKRGGAWMSNFVEQSDLRRQKPVVINVMNIQKPSEGQPTLLSFDEVTTMFHEFGHGVHGLFSAVHYPLLAGTNVPRDFVEFPSQFHEDFAFDPAVLARCAVHHETGEPLPAELVGKIQRARKFGQGFASLEYIAAAWLDMAWHSLAPGAVVDDVARFEREALEQAGVAWELVPPRYKSTYFSHVWPGGYSAGYYAYLWSEALAADGFACVMERGGMNGQNGAAFRDAVLSRGLTGEPLQMFEAFRGRPLDTGALLRRRGLA
ncbi:MAG: M3 family metallopeptidase [Planctomycetes bacterium]|nr:M3 family metallopeptidase [Planctomycetota bacterium]